MSKPPRPGDKPSLSRRTLFAGAGTVGAVAAAASLMPRVQTEQVAPADKPAPTRGGGYSLTDHVKQYYKTTLI
ncbi:MAG: formate dehydrogenase [Gammaproteobacteria bacterium]